MKKAKFIKAALLAAAMPMLLSSCATIVSGGSPKITIDGNLTEPVTITTAKQTYPNVTLPYVVKVNRHKLDGQRIYIQSETTRYKDVVLEKSTNGWAFGNILIGGLIGSEEEKSISKIPFLGDLPILGALFRTHRNSKSESELMIFLTAHVVK